MSNRNEIKLSASINKTLEIDKSLEIAILPKPKTFPLEFVAKMASHAIFQYNILAIDDTHNTWTNMIVKDEHSQAFRFK